jgi:hypothetical protein
VRGAAFAFCLVEKAIGVDLAFESAPGGGAGRGGVEATVDPGVKRVGCEPGT